MKTNRTDMRTLETIFKIRSKTKRAVLWIAGRIYIRRFIAHNQQDIEDKVYYNHFGIRNILGVPVKIGHPKIADDEIVLLCEGEYSEAKDYPLWD